MIVRAGDVLLSRLAPSVSTTEMWTLPGGGIDFGEHPDDAVVREVHEETGLTCVLGEPVWIDSAHRVVDRETEPNLMHSVRIVYDAWVAADAPEPRVIEVGGSTMDARWIPLVDVESGAVPTVPMVRQALAQHRPAPKQRLAAYALIRSGDRVLLTRNSVRGPRPGAWSLPGGGVEHGESPGREEDFHGVHLVFEATVGDGELHVRDGSGTTDAVRWFDLADLGSGAEELAAVVTAATGMRRGQ